MPLKRNPQDLEMCLHCRVKVTVEQHELTHLPFETGVDTADVPRVKESPHHESSPGGVSKFTTDYVLMSEDGTPITILGGYDGLTTSILC